MKVIENCIELQQSIILPDFNIEIIDIDTIFTECNSNYYNSVKALGLNLDFNFRKVDNKRLYTHEFLLLICKYITNSKHKLIFYKSVLAIGKDFRDILSRKLKTIFGLGVIEHDSSFSDFSKSLVIDSCESVSIIETLSNTKNKIKTFKHIKKYLKNNGLVHLDDVFFSNIRNKMILML